MQELLQALPVLFRGYRQFIAEHIEQDCLKSFVGILVGKHRGNGTMHRPGCRRWLDQSFHLLCQTVQVNRYEKMHIDIDQRAIKIKKDGLDIVEVKRSFGSFAEIRLKHG